MKKILITTLIVLASIPALAQHRHHGHHGGHYSHRNSGWGWGPVLGGAIAGAVIYDIYNRPVVVQQPPIVVQQPPVVVQQNCTAWTETMSPDGVVTKTRTCYN